MFGRIGPEELILILIVLLVIFGPSRLPELGGSLGRSMRSFKKAVRGEEDAASLPPASRLGSPAAADPEAGDAPAASDRRAG